MITYRNVIKEDLKEISRLHRVCFEGYFLSSLGEKLIEKYYESYVDEDAPFIVAVADNNEIAGFCMGYLSGSKARGNFESKYKYQLSLKLLLLCLKLDKQALIRVRLKMRSILKFSANKKRKNAGGKNPHRGTLLSICVSKEFRGTQTAQQMVREFENVLKTKNVTEYTLSVYQTNARAKAFYEKMGFKLSGSHDDSDSYLKEIL